MGGAGEPRLEQLPISPGVIREGFQGLGHHLGAQLLLAAGDGPGQLRQAHRGFLLLGPKLSGQSEMKLLQGIAGAGQLHVEAAAQAVGLLGEKIHDPVAAPRRGGLDFLDEEELLVTEKAFQTCIHARRKLVGKR